MQRPEYRKVFAISQSAIKAFSKSLNEFREIYIDKTKDDDNDDKYAFGSLVDTLAFTPDLLEKRFYVLGRNFEEPTPKIKKIVDAIYKKASEIRENKVLLNEKGNLPERVYVPYLNDIREWIELIYTTAKEMKYGGTTWGKNRIVENIIDEGGEYFSLLGDCNNRYVITTYDNADAMEMVEALRTDKDTRKYFIQQENETLLFQEELFIDFIDETGVIIPLKAALDIIRLDHSNRTVEVPDLKTTHSSESFIKVAREFGYITQASFYTFLIKEWIKTYEGGIYADYNVLTPINIVIDRKYKIPCIYEYDYDDLDIAMNGSKEKGIEGWMSKLKTIGWHMSTGIWDRPKELYENGKIKLKIYR